ncbi:MAG: succinate dehydrogenase assembly factor 2 [Gammaproteobacteria bacterium]|nr:succinate dehydrogenase assembly factor 2 [Gammaproteobacteria bacterium]MCP5136098.1 succinate dehydrogenase assembly factor 2 [Gammaproteobacteria bacterium]
MLELDLALGAYLETRYAGLDETGKRAFIELLALDDPTLNAWLLGNSTPADRDTASLMGAVRAAARTSA